MSDPDIEIPCKSVQIRFLSNEWEIVITTQSGETVYHYEQHPDHIFEQLVELGYAPNND